MKFFIFSVDTEPDCPTWTGFDYNHLEFKNFESLERFSDLLYKYEIPATFYITWSSASNEKVIDRLLKLKKDLNCEIAAHLHPGDTPPHRKNHTDNILELNNYELEVKFVSLHKKICEIYGNPESFRGAAWTIDDRTIRLLEKFKYTSDSSVTPGVSWKIRGRIDFTKTSNKPYIMDSSYPGRCGTSTLLEVPISIRTIVPQNLRITGFAGSLISMPLSSKGTILFQIMKRFPLKPQWLRPAFTKWETMKKVIDHSALRTGIAHAMCHSSEFALGTSPYTLDCRSHDNLWKRLDLMFSYIRSNDFIPITVSGYNDFFRKSVTVSNPIAVENNT